MITQLRLIGFFLVVLALLHAGFFRYFGWRREFAVVSLINRQMMYVHTFFIALAVLLMGLLYLSLRAGGHAAGSPGSIGLRGVLAGAAACPVFWLLAQAMARQAVRNLHARAIRGLLELFELLVPAGGPGLSGGRHPPR